MYKFIVFCLFFSLANGIVLSAQQTVTERNPPKVTPSQYFQSRLERIYVAINLKENNNISRYETELLSMMREQIISASESTGKKQYTKRMEEILASFEGFSFTTANKETTDAHLALLEEFWPYSCYLRASLKWHFLVI